jgi:two-component system response regulator DesR
MIRVLLADDEELIRTALAALLALEPDLEVVALAGDGHTAIEAVAAHRPDVAVIDLEMPGLDGIAVSAELAAAAPHCAVVILTGHGRPSHLQRALAAGTKGFLPKGSPAGALADVIRRVHAGARYVDPALAADALTAQPCPLTPRELDVLRAARPDVPVTAIARRVHLSQGTVRNHLAAIVTKLGVPGRAPPRCRAGCKQHPASGAAQRNRHERSATRRGYAVRLGRHPVHRRRGPDGGGSCARRCTARRPSALPGQCRARASAPARRTTDRSASATTMASSA